MRIKITFFLSLLLLLGTTSCEEFYDIVEELKPRPPKVKDFVSGLASPIGIEADPSGQLWVTEAGTGNTPTGTSDGQVSLITPEGKVYPVAQGFTSFKSAEGVVNGLNHLILKDEVLWILHGIEGRLYKLDVSNFRPGDKPKQAKDVDYEDLGKFILGYDFKEDTNESNIYNITIGPDDDFFIADAAANAIIRRDAGSGELSVFAEVPAIAGTGSGELPPAQSVPSGIVFDGERFLVSTFTGYPFPAQKAVIYELDLQGNVSVYQSGFSNLTDIKLGTDRHPVVVEYSNWTGQGFAPNAGRFIFSSRRKNVALLSGLNFPTSIERSGLKTYYILSNTDGKIDRAVF
ncbi:hypothetical protein AHMF7605_20190 [Adhaeribacter arboris]|uniref:ScyD/ScyE family protein n=1 Tax=Adhaeribacter arboris TaxID=2072846 RepID=A0A2T2YJI4_9BACT|nr:ScyD/ScyE family protein [Adhaeribacter arboris]PSR55659.1 hypothetical protein AHMF7605_20190 [Adhaeribacter arboris]